MNNEQEPTPDQIIRQARAAIEELRNIRHECQTLKHNERQVLQELTSIRYERQTLKRNKRQITRYLRHVKTQLHEIRSQYDDTTPRKDTKCTLDKS